MAKKILYFQHRSTGDCQNIEEGSQIAKMLKKSPKSWGEIKGSNAEESKKMFERALAGERVISNKYIKPATK